MKPTLKTAIARYGGEARAKLGNVAASGEPEDQLRAPLERLLADLAELCGFPRNAVAAVGESALVVLHTRPDYAITLRNALIGFLEIKAPGKGADPRKFRGHDKEQWEKLQPLPNLLYTDGNQFSLWRSGQQEGAVVVLHGDVETSGAALDAPPELVALFDNFFRWEPIPPGSAGELAKVSARRLLTDDTENQATLKTSLGTMTRVLDALNWPTIDKGDPDAVCRPSSRCATKGLFTDSGCHTII